MDFLHTKSRKINLLSDQHCISRSARKIKKVLEIVRKQYEDRELEIYDYHGNNELYILTPHYFLQPLNIYIYAKYDPVGTN